MAVRQKNVHRPNRLLKGNGKAVQKENPEFATVILQCSRQKVSFPMSTDNDHGSSPGGEVLWWAPNAAHDLGGLSSQGLQLCESCGSGFYARIQV